MGEWRQCLLSELCDQGLAELQTGPFGSQLHAHDYVEEGVPVVPTEAIRARKINHEMLPKISETKAAELTRHRLRIGDILFARRGVQATGHTGFVRDTEDGFICGTGAIRLRITRDNLYVFPEYLSHVFANPASVAWFKFHAIGATMPNLNEGIIRSFPLSLPPLDIQAQVSKLLSALDDKIELNRQTNETLEAMARALFKDWFVDFGPTRGKAEGRAPYLAPELWELFPDALDDDDKPVGWENKPLDEIAEFLNGLALQKFPASDPDDSLPVIKIAELRGGITAKSNRASREVPDKYIVKDGDFLFSWSGSLLAKFWTEGEGALNQHLFKVTSDRYPEWFFSQWVHHHLDEFQAIAASKATTMGHIQRGHLKAAMTHCPPDDVLSKLGQTVAPLVDACIKNELESRTLAQTRDLLLPKLMSGEIRLRDAEKAVEAVA
ncbi:MAG: restriction endonuclease subunit S [Chromatiaceae bacterium]|nr:restriction endonuclease subunit S [Chromatiaceae bacterium]